MPEGWKLQPPPSPEQVLGKGCDSGQSGSLTTQSGKFATVFQPSTG